MPVFPHEHLAHGDRVEVTEGPLDGPRRVVRSGQAHQGPARAQRRPARPQRGGRGRLHRRQVVQMQHRPCHAHDPNRPHASLLVWPLSPRRRRCAGAHGARAVGRRSARRTTTTSSRRRRAAGDAMMLVTPAFEAFYESPTTSFRGLFTFDMQRAVGYSTLNSLDAKRHAMLNTGVPAEPAVPSLAHRPLRRVGSPGRPDVRHRRAARQAARAPLSGRHRRSPIASVRGRR